MFMNEQAASLPEFGVLPLISKRKTGEPCVM